MGKAIDGKIGERIRERRDFLNKMSQKTLARAVGISVTTLQSYEAGQIPKGEYLPAMAYTLKCSIDWLITGTGPVEARSGQEAERARGQTRGVAHMDTEDPDIELATAMRLLSDIYYGGNYPQVAAVGITLKTFVEAERHRQEKYSLESILRETQTQLDEARAELEERKKQKNGQPLGD